MSVAVSCLFKVISKTRQRKTEIRIIFVQFFCQTVPDICPSDNYQQFVFTCKTDVPTGRQTELANRIVSFLPLFLLMRQKQPLELARLSFETQFCADRLVALLETCKLEHSVIHECLFSLHVVDFPVCRSFSKSTLETWHATVTRDPRRISIVKLPVSSTKVTSGNQPYVGWE